jgi:hypothetical protein
MSRCVADSPREWLRSAALCARPQDGGAEEETLHEVPAPTVDGAEVGTGEHHVT